MFVGTALLATHSDPNPHAMAQDTNATTLLVTSFVPGPDAWPEIFQINIDGSGRKPLLEKKNMVFDPSLSPDGKRIAFAGCTEDDPKDENAKWGLFVMNADGSARKQLTASKALDEHLLAPRWSPDGKQLAFCTFRFGFKGNGTGYSSAPHIHVINSDGKNLKRLGKVEGINPVWSPDGKQLLFTRVAKKDEATGLFAVDTHGENLRQLVKPVAQGSLMGAAWSPDGKSLAYVVTANNARAPVKGGLFLAQADGSQPKRLAGGPDENIFGVQWSTDGKRLFFTRQDRSGPFLNATNPAGGRGWGACAVYAIDVDGQNLRRVTVAKQSEYIGGNYLFAMLIFAK
jgi:Tol biopolymer transport system component